MAIYRSVHTTFWTDTKVADKFTPEDKYFMLYCLTNNYTNLIGCYEISIKQMAYDLGYSKDSVEHLLHRFVDVHKMIDYDFKTNELFIKNWHKYNWTTSEKLEKPLIAAISKVKNINFKEELIDIYNSREKVNIPYPYGIDTTDTDTITNTNTTSNSNSEIIKEIIDYLNVKTSKSFRSNNKETIKHINARLKEGYTIEDFKKVIDIKTSEWLNTNMDQYLRPQTLFNNKFESYLNTKVNTVSKSNGNDDNVFADVAKRFTYDESKKSTTEYNYDELDF